MTGTVPIVPLLLIATAAGLGCGLVVMAFIWIQLDYLERVIKILIGDIARRLGEIERHVAAMREEEVE